MLLTVWSSVLAYSKGAVSGVGRSTFAGLPLHNIQQQRVHSHFIEIRLVAEAGYGAYPDPPQEFQQSGRLQFQNLGSHHYSSQQ